MSRHFMEMTKAMGQAQRFVCVGLDSDDEEIAGAPEILEAIGSGEGGIGSDVVEFNLEIIKATSDIAGCYKPNFAFYAALGDEGIDALRQTIILIHRIAPEIPVILDAKVADIGNTNRGYVREAFDYCCADAITVHPYLGAEALAPFLSMKDKGIIVLCRTSNMGGGELQDLRVLPRDSEEKGFFLSRIPNDELTVIGISGSMLLIKFYQHLAYRVANHWNANGNCALVAGATYPEELGIIRRIVGDMPLLIPAVGKQGGEAKVVVPLGKNSVNAGMIINSSRGIIFASKGADFAAAARAATEKLHNEILAALAAEEEEQL